jgi:hypothetical protein
MLTLTQQQWVNAEIAARMMVSDYPDSTTAIELVGLPSNPMG